MSTLTEEQEAKLYGHKEPFIPSAYRIRQQNELETQVRMTQRGRFSKRALGEVVMAKLKKKPKLLKIIIPEPSRTSPSSRGGVPIQTYRPMQNLIELPKMAVIRLTRGRLKF